MEKNKNGMKVILGILAILLLVSVGVGIKLYSDQRTINTQLEEDKQDLIFQLDEIRGSYEDVNAQNEVISKDLEEAKGRISSYIDSLKASRADVAYLRKFRQQVQILKEEREKLLAENEQLRAANKILILERDSTAVALREKTRFSDSLAMQNSEMNKVIEDGSLLLINDVQSEGVKVRSSGKILSTDKASRADKIRICFSLSANRIAKAGEREFYIQVLDPKNVVIGANEVEYNEGQSLNYSKRTKFYYENNPLDVCDYIEPLSGGFAKGRYTISVYEDFRLVSQTELTLN